MEGVVGAHQKRSDLWSLFVDKEAKAGHVAAARGLLRRVTCMSWKAHTMKGLFKKWVRFEQQHGDADAVEAVKDRAREYVASVTQ